MIWAILFFGCVLGASYADEKPAEGLRAEVKQLVRDLDADKIAVREESEKKLIEKGEAALDFLPQADDGMSAESQDRLVRIRLKIQKAAAELAAQPTLITLEAKKMPLADALAALEKQSGNRFVDYRERFGQEAGAIAVDYSCEKKPFWSVVDEMLDRSDLALYPYGGEGVLQVVSRNPLQTDRVTGACYAGPFRITAEKMIAQRILREKGPSHLDVVLGVAWEPRLKPIVMTQKSANVMARDENGEPLASSIQGAEVEIAVQSDQSTAELLLPFISPPRNVKNIKTIKGSFGAILPGRIETFRFDKLTKTKRVEKRGGGVTVTLEYARKNNNLWEIAVTTRYENPGEAMASHRGWIFQNEVYLESPGGEKQPYDGMETIKQSDEEIGVAYMFVLDEPPEDKTFVYKTPGAILNAQFDYELKDLPLP